MTVARSAKISGEETRLGAPAPAGCHGLGLGLGLGLGSVRRKIAASGKEIDKPELGFILFLTLTLGVLVYLVFFA